MKNTILGTLGVLACGFALAGCGASEEQADPVESTAEAGDSPLFATVGEMGELSTAHGLIEEAGLENAFVGVGSYTLLLPGDEAFAQLPEEDLARFQTEEGRPELIALLRRHIAVGAITQGDLEKAIEDNDGSLELASVADTPITLQRSGERIALGEGEDAPGLTGTARPASNGVVYVIDGLIPPED